jgi:hypothetical protein
MPDGNTLRDAIEGTAGRVNPDLMAGLFGSAHRKGDLSFPEHVFLRSHSPRIIRFLRNRRFTAPGEQDVKSSSGFPVADYARGNGGKPFFLCDSDIHVGVIPWIRLLKDS